MILVLLRQNRTWCHPDGEETVGVKHGGHQAMECKKSQEANFCKNKSALLSFRVFGELAVTDSC